MENVIQRFAARMHNLRAERGMTQEELAARSGLHTRYISALECGRQTPGLTTLAQLAKGLDVELRALTDFENEGKPKSDRLKEEVELITRRLRKVDLPAVRRIRAIIEILTKS